jgi:hypothetical protein
MTGNGQDPRRNEQAKLLVVEDVFHSQIDSVEYGIEVRERSALGIIQSPFSANERLGF